MGKLTGCVLGRRTSHRCPSRTRHCLGNGGLTTWHPPQPISVLHQASQGEEGEGDNNTGIFHLKISSEEVFLTPS